MVLLPRLLHHFAPVVGPPKVTRFKYGVRFPRVTDPFFVAAGKAAGTSEGVVEIRYLSDIERRNTLACKRGGTLEHLLHLL